MTDLANVIECMLLRWGDTSASGKTVTFLLSEDGGDNPFKGLKCGPANGQRLALSVALINDDETQLPQLIEASGDAQPAPAERENVKPGRVSSIAQYAGALCNHPPFWKFLTETYEYLDVSSSEKAADVVRELCNVNSRRDIESNPDALKSWRSIVENWRGWQQEPSVVPTRTEAREAVT